MSSMVEEQKIDGPISEAVDNAIDELLSMGFLRYADLEEESE